MSARRWLLPAALLFVLVLQCSTQPRSEPFFHNDETRHLMTGVFYRDLLGSLPVRDLREWTSAYYAQYPALGILIWPPFFHLVEGIWMTAFGTGTQAARGLVALFLLLACGALFRMVERASGPWRAAMAVAAFGAVRIGLEFGGYVMLEIPALAMGLLALLHWSRYLDRGRARNLAFAAAALAAAVLTRFDALLYLPALLAATAIRGKLGVLRRPGPWIALACVAVAVAPVCWLTAREVGWIHAGTLVPGVSEEMPPLLAPWRLAFYPARLPAQVGWPLTVLALVGLVRCLAPGRRRPSAEFLALVLATYCVLTPIGELEARHAMPWIAAVAFLAVEAIALVPAWPAQLALLAVAVVLPRGWDHRVYVRGYAEAARLAVARPRATIFFDGFLEGNFVYQVRHLDPRREARVIRADRTLYIAGELPEGQARVIVRGDSAIVRAMRAYKPDWVVVEYPWIGPWTATAQAIRHAILSRPDCFHLEHEVPIKSNHPEYRGRTLRLYRCVCPPEASLPQAPPIRIPELRESTTPARRPAPAAPAAP